MSKFCKTVLWFELMFLSVLTSCKRSGYVKGTVYENGTNIPIPNAVVNFSREYAHKGARDIISTTTTDSNGKYKITYDVVGGRHYYVSAGNLVDGTGDVELTSKKLALDLSLSPAAYLKIYANKTSSSNNYLVINGPYPLDFVSSPKSSSPYNLLVHAHYSHLTIDNNPSDSPYFFLPTNKTYTISWTVYDNNGPTSTTGQAQFNASKGDTLTYTIPFN